MNGGRGARAEEGGWYVGLHSITHSIDVDYRQNTSIRQHLTMTSARVHVRAYNVGGRYDAWRGFTVDTKSHRIALSMIYMLFVNSTHCVIRYQS